VLREQAVFDAVDVDAADDARRPVGDIPMKPSVSVPVAVQRAV